MSFEAADLETPPTDTIEAQSLSFVLPDSLSIETAEPLCEILKQIPLMPGLKLSLDASRVECVTTPGIQLLLALNKALQAQGGALELARPHPSVLQCLADIGLENMFVSKRPEGDL